MENIMKTKVGVLGSCISRDAFNSNFVPNYKDYFKIEISAQRVSMISLMQKPINIDENLIKITPNTPENNARTDFIKYDLKKSLLNELIEKNIEYLIIDNYLEIRMGILYFEDNIITNNNWDLPRTEFYKNLEEKFILNIIDYPEEYFNIWSKYCDLFFNFINKNCPNLKVILNKGRAVDKVIKEDGSIYINPDFTKMANEINFFLDKLDSYIQNNFDVYVINFDFNNTFADENHIWGFGPVHYSKNYPINLINCVKDITKDNAPKNYDISENPVVSSKSNFFIENHVEELNNKTKLSINKIIIKKLKNELKYRDKLLDSLENELKTKKMLSIYGTGRIDLKNFGSKDNAIEIIENTDVQSKIDSPPWFKSEQGEGTIIESKRGKIDLKIRCIHDGLLKIYLRGSDIRDRNNKRFPVYIDYTNFLVNGETFIDENILVSYENYYLFQKEVKNLEIINIHIEWNPFTNSSNYSN